MNRRSSVDDELFKKYPHYKIYKECQTRAFTVGTFTLTSAAAGVYVAQELLKETLPYSRKSFLLSSVLIGSIAAYFVTRWKTKECQDMWLALEDKHTALTRSSEAAKRGSDTEKPPKPTNSW